MLKLLARALVALLLVAGTADAQSSKPPINANNGNTTSTQLGSIMTDKLGTGRLVYSSVVPTPVEKYGVVCDGSTDTTTAFNAMLTAAAAAGEHITANGKTCAISAHTAVTRMPNGTWLQDMTVKQLASNDTSSVRTLQNLSSAGPITLVRVSINRNGSGSDTTSPTVAAGLYLAGTSSGTQLANVYLEDVEVYGDGPGQGIVITDATAPRVIRPHVHDMHYTSSVDPCIEQVYGMFFARATDVYLEEPWIEALGGTITAGVPSGTSGSCLTPVNFTGSISGSVLTVTAFTQGDGTLVAGMLVNAAAANIAANTQILSQATGSAGSTGTYNLVVSHATVTSEAMSAGGTGSWSTPNTLRYYQTDGFDTSSVTGMTMIGGYIRHVGEGTDLGGTLGSKGLTFIAPRYVDIDSYGYKISNGVTNAKVIGGSCINCGFAGAIVRASVVQTAHVNLSNWTSTNTGSNGLWSAQAVVGVVSSPGGSSVADFVCSFCTIVDDQVTATTKYGFRNGGGTPAEFSIDHWKVDASGGAFVANMLNFTTGLVAQNTGGALEASAVQASGAVPTPSGACAVNTQTGGNTAGTFKANGVCTTSTVILTFATTAATGWACTATDRTTPADVMSQTASSTTTATFTGSMADLDVVSFSCTAY